MQKLNLSQLRKRKVATSSSKVVTFADHVQKRIDLLNKEANAFKAAGMKGSSPDGWIEVDADGTILIGIKFSTKFLPMNDEGCNQYESSKDTFNDDIAVITEAIRQGLVDKPLQEQLKTRKAGAAKAMATREKNRKQKQQQVAA